MKYITTRCLLHKYVDLGSMCAAHTSCYRPECLCSSKIQTLQPNPQRDSIRRSLWEASRSSFISVLIKEMPESSPAPSVMWGNSEKMIVDQPGNQPSSDIESASDVTLDFLASTTVRNTFLLFISSQVRGILLQQPKWTKSLAIWPRTNSLRPISEPVYAS